MGGGGNICHSSYLTESSLCYTDSISCYTDFLSCHTDLLPCHTEQSEVSQRHNEQSRTFTTKQNLATFLEGSLMEIAKNELSLESVQWGEFKICDLFERIEKGKCKNFNQETKISKNGVSFLSATINNNGVSAFVEKNSLLQKGNCIMFVNQGDGGAGYAAYKREDFVATTSCSFGYADWVNKYTGLFVASILCRFKEKYSFGYGRTEARLKNDVVMLPLDSKGNPNYAFMESFMKNLEQKHLQKILAYYTHKLDSSGGGGVIPFDYNDYCAFIESSKQDSTFSYTCNLDKLQWREFVVGEIFEVKATKNGIDKNKLSGKKGKIPYITRTENQNGVDDFIAEQENYLKNERNVIIIGLDTQTAFYHNSEFYTGQNIQILKNANLNQYNALFMIQALRNLMTKFNWGGNGATLTRLKRGKILLPIDSKGNPHYEFMESFMKNLEQKHLQKILAYYTHKLDSSGGGG